MKKKVVIVGGGFTGTNVLKRLMKYDAFEVTLVDKNNYNYFTPLIYQVATGFIEPSSISYPFRSLISGQKNAHFWLGTLKKILPEEQKIILSNGLIKKYSKIAIARGIKIDWRLTNAT